MKKAAVVGLGIGLAHVAGYLEHPDVALVAVCDLTPERLSAVGGTFRQGSMLVLKDLFSEGDLEKRWQDIGVTPYSSLDEMLEKEDLDIVSLCTPDYTHEDLAVRILRAGKHLLLEKPVSITLDGAENVRRALADSRTVFGIGYEFRINPAVRRMKELVDTGAVGRVEAFSLYHYRTPFRRDKWNHWIQKKEYSGGLIVEETCHWFDLARYITGKEIDAVQCYTNGNIHPDFDYEDIAFINGKYDDGAIFQISHALTGYDFSLVLTVHGRKGTIWCGLKEEERSSLDAFQTDYYGVVSHGPMNGSVQDAGVVTFGSEATEPENIREYVKHFCDCVIGGKKPLAGYEDGLRSVEVALMSGRSAEAGVPVRRSEIV